jgi:hypothetical protein
MDNTMKKILMVKASQLFVRATPEEIDQIVTAAKRRIDLLKELHPERYQAELTRPHAEVSCDTWNIPKEKWLPSQ